MNIGIDAIVFLVFLAVLVLIVVGTPTCLIVFGLKRHRRLHSLGAKVMIGTGMVIFSIYLLAIVPRITGVGPYRSEILAKGTSPDGIELRKIVYSTNAIESLNAQLLPGRLLSLQLSKRPGSNQRADAR